MGISFFHLLLLCSSPSCLLDSSSESSIMMKVILIAIAIACASAFPLEEENDFGKECLDIQHSCMAAATSKLERVQCWMQFGLCVATHGMKCYTKCIPPMKQCIEDAQHDFMKVLRCGADYIECVTTCE